MRTKAFAAFASLHMKFAVMLDVAISYLAFPSWLIYPKKKTPLLYHFVAAETTGKFQVSVTGVGTKIVR